MRMDERPGAGRIGYSGSARLMRDMGLAGMLGLSAAVASLYLWPAATPDAPSISSPEGKLVDRLAFTAPEVIPVRETRVYDSLAMFARPAAEPAPWSEALPPILPAPAGAAQAGKAGRPAVASLAAEAGRRDLVLPPARPAQTAGTGVAATGVAATRRLDVVTASDPERASLKIAGWSIPGSQYLPDREDAAAAIDFVDDGARSLGSGAVRMATDGVNLVGRSVSRVGHSVASSVRLP